MLSQLPGQLSKSQQILKGNSSYFPYSCDTAIQLASYRLILEYVFWTVYRMWCLFKQNLNASSWIHLIQWLMGTDMEWSAWRVGPTNSSSAWWREMELVGRERCWCTGDKKEGVEMCELVHAWFIFRLVCFFLCGEMFKRYQCWESLQTTYGYVRNEKLEISFEMDSYAY